MASQFSCLKCNSSSIEVVESRLCSNGTRRRRHSCLACGYRWTTWDGPRPAQGRIPGVWVAAKTKRGQEVTEEEVRAILLAPKNIRHTTLARQLNVTPQTVRSIRMGIRRRTVCPGLPRWDLKKAVKGRSCYNCEHWSLGCGFGFPDPQEEGPGYAQDCDLFQLKAQND